MRKWIEYRQADSLLRGKAAFPFPFCLPDETHLSMRSMSMRGKQQLLQAGTPRPQAMQKFNDTFWDAEMMLRRIFDSYGSDRDSGVHHPHYDFEQLKQRRRANYQYLLEPMPEHPQITVIFRFLKRALFPATLPCHARTGTPGSVLSGRTRRQDHHPIGPGPMVDTGRPWRRDYIYSHAVLYLRPEIWN